MTRHSILALAIVLGGGGVLVSCTGDDQPSPGGINGPARVDPDSEVNSPVEGQDD